MYPPVIPFEIHLTTAHLTRAREQAFADLCFANEAKPLRIELAQGEHTHQPMLSKVVYAANLHDVLAVATALSEALHQAHYPVTRLKIEVPSSDADLAQAYLSETFKPYFEWHGKVTYQQVAMLYALCEKHRVHLSRNALKNESNTRFITIREYGTRASFESRIEALVTDLNNSGWTVSKPQSEYCIYDNNTYLDKGWLPQ